MVRCGFSKPREGGVYGVWVASMVMGLLSMPRLGPDVVLGLVGSLASLFMANPSRVRLYCVGLVSLMFLPLVALHLPYSLAPLVLFPPLFYATLRGGTLRYVTGAGLVALPGGLLALASETPWVSVLPPLYAMMASGMAYRRIYGSSPHGLEVASGAGVFVYGVALILAGARLAGLVLLVDVVLRLVVRVFGWDLGVRLRTYGFIEAFRSLAVMTVVGLDVGFLS